MAGWPREREAVKSVYNTKSWHRKVDLMSDDQIVAIYMRFKRERKVP